MQGPLIKDNVPFSFSSNLALVVISEPIVEKLAKGLVRAKTGLGVWPVEEPVNNDHFGYFTPKSYCLGQN